MSNQISKIKVPGLLFFCLPFVALMFAGCEHKDLCYEHPHTTPVRIVFDWKKSPDASPEGMCVFFYPVNPTGDVLRFDFPNTDGGDISLPLGEYHIIAYNNDTKATQFAETDRFDTHRAFTREGNILEPVAGSGYSSVPRANEAQDERVVIAPDMVWGVSEERRTVDDTTKEIVLYPSQMVCRYTCEIRNVTNLKLISQMCASLSGLSPGIMMSDATHVNEQITVPFTAGADGGNTIRCSFLTFGYDTSLPRQNRLFLYVWTRDGRKLCYGITNDRFEVSQQILDAPDKYNVHIVIDGLELPTPIENGNGFNPAVDDWTIINQNILM